MFGTHTHESFGARIYWLRTLATALLFAFLPWGAHAEDENATTSYSGGRAAKSVDRKSAKFSKSSAKPAAQKDIDRARQLVVDALQFEIAGDDENRNITLASARAIAPDEPSTNWHHGFVNLQRRWLSVDDATRSMQNDPKIRAYLRKRAESADTELGNQRLAAWCAERGLSEQARVHFNRTLELNSNNVVARAALGYRRFRGGWFTQAEIAGRIQAQAKYVQQLIDWLPKTSRLASDFQSADLEVKSAAAESLAGLKDLDAIPALECTFSLVDQELALVLVNKLAEWHDQVATESMMRQAVYSPGELVRRSASEKLGSRPQEEVVPTLLKALRTPVQRLVWVGLPAGGRNGFGQLAYRQLFVHDGREGLEVLQLTNVYQATASRKGDVNTSLQRLALEYRQQRALDEAAASIQNWQAQELNQRVMDCLQTATGQSTLTTVDDWKNWWDEKNETVLAGPRVTKLLSLQRDIVISDDGYEPATEAVSEWYVPPVRHSCFCAGTLVHTSLGAVPIETVKVGDLVLSQSPNTGELGFRSVMRTTVRPGAQVFTIETSGTTLRATGGHLFWVAGEGWTKARNLRSGQILHCANGTVRVSLVSEEAQPEQTYNLVVADFNTYFVGAERILTHDVTERKPTRSIVPGLARN